MNLESLPDDVLLEVFSCLHDPYEVVQCCAASRRLQHIGKNQCLWHDFARRKYAHPQQKLYRGDWRQLFQERNGFGNPLLAQRVYPSPPQSRGSDGEEEHEIAAVAAQGDAVLVAQGTQIHLLQLQPPTITHPAEVPSSPEAQQGEIGSATQLKGTHTRSSRANPVTSLCASANFGSAVPTALCILQGCDQQHGMPSSIHVAVGTLPGELHLLIFEKLPQHQSNHRATLVAYTSHIEPLVSATGVRLQGGSIPISQACKTTDCTLAALHDNFLSSSLDLPPSFVEFVDVAAQQRTGMTRDVMDSWALVAINCLAGSSKSSSDAPSSVDPHVLLAGSVSTPCSRCWEAFMPWLCGHKQHAALAALSILDTRLPGYVAERFTLQHRSLYPHLASARGSRPHVFTSHADCPLCVWDLRRMSVPIFASNSRNLDHQTEGPLGRAEFPAPNQAMFLDASEDVLLGRALNGTLWIWDLAELLGWQDGSGGLGVWEALEYLSPWESHSLPPKAWPLCLGALQPGANILPVSCLVKGSDPTSLLVVTDPRSSCEGAALPHAEKYRIVLEGGDEPWSTSSDAELAHADERCGTMSEEEEAAPQKLQRGGDEPQRMSRVEEAASQKAQKGHRVLAGERGEPQERQRGHGTMSEEEEAAPQEAQKGHRVLAGESQEGEAQLEAQQGGAQGSQRGQRVLAGERGEPQERQTGHGILSGEAHQGEAQLEAQQGELQESQGHKGGQAAGLREGVEGGGVEAQGESGGGGGNTHGAQESPGHKDGQAAGLREGVEREGVQEAQGKSGSNTRGEWWEDGTYYSGAWGVSLECWHCGELGHFMRSCPLLLAEMAEERAECAERVEHAQRAQRAEQAQHAEERAERVARVQRSAQVWAEEYVQRAERAQHAGECAEGAECAGHAQIAGHVDTHAARAEEHAGEHAKHAELAEHADKRAEERAERAAEHAQLAGHAEEYVQQAKQAEEAADWQGVEGESEEVVHSGQCHASNRTACKTLSTEGPLRVGATPALSAGGVGEQLVRISLCRR